MKEFFKNLIIKNDGNDQEVRKKKYKHRICHS